MQRFIAVLTGIAGLVYFGVPFFRPFPPPLPQPSLYNRLLVLLAILPMVLAAWWPEAYGRLRTLSLRGRLGIGLLLVLLVAADARTGSLTSPLAVYDLWPFLAWGEVWFGRGRLGRRAEG